MQKDLEEKRTSQNASLIIKERKNSILMSIQILHGTLKNIRLLQQVRQATQTDFLNMPMETNQQTKDFRSFYMVLSWLTA